MKEKKGEGKEEEGEEEEEGGEEKEAGRRKEEEKEKEEKQWSWNRVALAQRISGSTKGVFRRPYKNTDVQSF